MSPEQPQELHHVIRVRTSDDLSFVRGGLADEVLLNANQLENGPESAAAALRGTRLPYSIDPMLHRFQKPEWWRNAKGDTKRNYARLGRAYVKGTTIELPAGPLADIVANGKEWQTLAQNAISYQRERLNLPTQLDLLAAEEPPVLRPQRLNAPALVADSTSEDDINRLLAEASAEAAAGPVSVSVIVPMERLTDPRQLDLLLNSLPTKCASSYFVWTPRVTEERLLDDHKLFVGIVRLITELKTRGAPVGHLHGSYAIAALHGIGVDALVHHLGWRDRGEPAEQTRGGPRACLTYVPGLRRSVRFDLAYRLGRSLDAAVYGQRYCNCAFCLGAFDAGEHPLDLLLESEMVATGRGGQRPTPTGRAVAANTWHYLLSRRQEVEAFSARSATEVVDEDIKRAAALADRREVNPLRRLATELAEAA